MRFLNPAELIGTSIKAFHARSAEREKANDLERVLAIICAVDAAIEAASAERTGLVKRIKTLVETPWERWGQLLPWFESDVEQTARELAKAEERLREIANCISSYEALRLHVVNEFDVTGRCDADASPTQSDTHSPT